MFIEEVYQQGEGPDAEAYQGGRMEGGVVSIFRC